MIIGIIGFVITLIDIIITLIDVVDKRRRFSNSFNNSLNDIIDN